MELICLSTVSIAPWRIVLRNNHRETEARQELSKRVDIKIEFKYVKHRQGKTSLVTNKLFDFRILC